MTDLVQYCINLNCCAVASSSDQVKCVLSKAVHKISLNYFHFHLLLTGMFPNVSSFGNCSESDQSKFIYTSTRSTDRKKKCKQIQLNDDIDAFSSQIPPTKQQLSSNDTSNSDFYRTSKSTVSQYATPKEGYQIVLQNYLYLKMFLPKLGLCNRGPILLTTSKYLSYNLFISNFITIQVPD